MANIFYQLGKKVGKSVARGKFLYSSLSGEKNKALTAEYNFGAILAKEIVDTYGYYDAPYVQIMADAVLKKLVERVKNKNRYFSVKIINSNELNAFALPGGFIFITSKLINLLKDKPDALAFVLAHEMVHIVAKHPFKRLMANYSLQVVSQLARSSSPATMLGKSIVQNVVRSHYSKGNEYQADIYGVRLMYSAGYSPQGALEVLEFFSRYRNGEDSFNYFSTHPSLTERLSIVKKLVQNLEETE